MKIRPHDVGSHSKIRFGFGESDEEQLRRGFQSQERGNKFFHNPFRDRLPNKDEFEMFLFYERRCAM